MISFPPLLSNSWSACHFVPDLIHQASMVFPPLLFQLLGPRRILPPRVGQADSGLSSTNFRQRLPGGSYGPPTSFGCFFFPWQSLPTFPFAHLSRVPLILFWRSFSPNHGCAGLSPYPFRRPPHHTFSHFPFPSFFPIRNFLRFFPPLIGARDFPPEQPFPLAALPS